MDYGEFVTALIENRIPCQECKHAELHEVFAICKNEKAAVFGEPVRLTASCIHSEKKVKE